MISESTQEDADPSAAPASVHEKGTTQVRRVRDRRGVTTESSTSVNERLLGYVRILVGLAIVVGLWWGQIVWIPLVLSVLISYALEPVVAFLACHRVPRSLGVPLLLIALVATLGGGAYVLRGQAGAFIDGLPSTAPISAIVGIIIWISFALLGLNQAGVWGVLSAVLFAIPIVGPIVAFGAASAAAFVQSGSTAMVLGIAGVCLAVGTFEGNVLTPWFMSRVGEVNAVAVFVSLLFWGWIWGVWGLLLAVPITAAIKAVCERVPDFAAVAELLKE